MCLLRGLDIHGWGRPGQSDLTLRKIQSFNGGTKYWNDKFAKLAEAISMLRVTVMRKI